MKTPINTRGFLTDSFPTPYYSMRNNHHWTRWPIVLSSNLTHSVILWSINYRKCLQWSNNFLLFFFKKTQNKSSHKLTKFQLLFALLIIKLWTLQRQIQKLSHTLPCSPHSPGLSELWSSPFPHLTSRDIQDIYLMSKGTPAAVSTLGIRIFWAFLQVSKQDGTQGPPEQEQKQFLSWF